MDLFSAVREQNRHTAAPLADRLRPRTLAEFVGQQNILGPGKLLRRLIQADQLRSVIFYGPPGTGKTTLAKIIANTTKSHFVQLNAVVSGIGDLRQVVSEAKEKLGIYGQKTILFVDEIHRFNKAQQDAMLPHVEDGTVILIGATTENPYFEVNTALLSRSTLFRLEPLAESDMDRLINQALTDKERGLGNYNVTLYDEAKAHLLRLANGDARTLLNALELAIITTEVGQDGRRHITLAVAEESIQRPAIHYDKSGDQHYDVISAFIKSMRGSDPDATLYWLARMLEAGEDPKFIARRLVVHAAEDVGLADANALNVAISAARAVEFLGLPEGRIPLAEAALYIACAPKSNSVILGIDRALADVRAGVLGQVPAHLRDAHYKGAVVLGHGKGYKYPHDYEGNYVEQQYLPDGIESGRYYPRTKI